MGKRLGILMMTLCMAGTLTLRANAQGAPPPVESSQDQAQMDQIRQDLQSLRQQAEALRKQLQPIMAQAKPLQEQLRAIREKMRADREKLGGMHREHHQKHSDQAHPMQSKP